MAEAKKNILTPDGLKALEDELQELEQKGIIKDEWDRFLDNPICPDCGSKNVIYF